MLGWLRKLRKKEDPEEEKEYEGLFKDGLLIEEVEEEDKSKELEGKQPQEEPPKEERILDEPHQPKRKQLLGKVINVNRRLIQEFEHYLANELGRLPRTVEEYVWEVGRLAEWLYTNKKKSLRSASDEDIREWVAYLKANGKSASYINRNLSALRTFYKFCVRERYVIQNPASPELVNSLKIPARIPVFLTDDQFKKVEEHLNNGLPPKVKTIVALWLYAGLRISESISLRRDSLIWEGDDIVAIRVIGKGDKERIVPVHPKLNLILKEYLKTLDSKLWLFPGKKEGEHIDRRTAYALFVRYVKKPLGLPEKISPHKFRHTFATRLYRKGTQLLDISKLLGHAQLETTKIYTHTDYENLKKIVENL